MSKVNTILLITLIFLVTTTTLKVDRIQTANDGGYILSASPGYTFDNQCEHPYWYLEDFDLSELYRVIKLSRPCNSSTHAYTTSNFKERIYDDQ